MTSKFDCDNLVLDGNNICYINFFSNKDAGEDEILGLTYMYSLVMIKNVFNMFKPKNIVIAFDSHSWRKEYTKYPELCLTHKVYKAHRKTKMEPSIRRKLEMLEKDINNFSDMLQNSTSMLVLKRHLLEGDDLIGGFVNANKHEKNLIVSSDKDFMQLIDVNTKLFDPVKGKFRELDEHDHDNQYFLFEKCIRGDAGDNVMSSYPRIRSTLIKKAYTDDFTKNNIMNHEFDVEIIDSDTQSLKKLRYKTSDIFQENMTLMSLYHQPDEIKELINDTITQAHQKRNRFTLFNFLKFCGNYQMENTVKFVEHYSKMLNIKPLTEFD